MIEEIYRLFLRCPAASGALVFCDNSYEGVLLKRDLELAIKEQDEEIADKIMAVPPAQAESYLFSGRPRNKTLIPCVSSDGRPLEPLLYEEFISEFFPEDYRLRFSLAEVVRFYEYPVLVLNRFKTVVYANNEAEMFFDDPPLNRRIGDLLEGFTLSAKGDRLLVSRGGNPWIMFAASSRTPFGVFYIYQFIRCNEEGCL